MSIKRLVLAVILSPVLLQAMRPEIIFKDKEFFVDGLHVQRCDVDPLLRKIQSEEQFNAIKEQLPIRVKTFDNGEKRLSLEGGLNGGGPVTAWCVWVALETAPVAAFAIVKVREKKARKRMRKEQANAREREITHILQSDEGEFLIREEAEEIYKRDWMQSGLPEKDFLKFKEEEFFGRNKSYDNSVRKQAEERARERIRSWGGEPSRVNHNINAFRKAAEDCQSLQELATDPVGGTIRYLHGEGVGRAMHRLNDSDAFQRVFPENDATAIADLQGLQAAASNPVNNASYHSFCGAVFTWIALQPWCP